MAARIRAVTGIGYCLESHRKKKKKRGIRKADTKTTKQQHTHLSSIWSHKRCARSRSPVNNSDLIIISLIAANEKRQIVSLTS
jgi:hypothetical protein